MSEYAAYTPRCASPHRRRAISTSAVRAPRSSTGSTRASTAESSCSASRTPTRRAAPTKARARSSRDWSGSASTGTRKSSTRARISSAIRPTRSGCSTPARPIAASARRRSSSERRAEAEARKESVQVRSPLRSPHARRESSAASRCGDAVRRALPRSRGQHRVGRPRARADHVPEQGSRGLRHPPLRRHADLQSGRRLRRHRDGHHARDARRRPHLEHAEADPALSRVRRRAARCSPTCR